MSRISHYWVLSRATGLFTLQESIGKVPDWQVTQSREIVCLLTSSFFYQDGKWWLKLLWWFKCDKIALKTGYCIHHLLFSKNLSVWQFSGDLMLMLATSRHFVRLSWGKIQSQNERGFSCKEKVLTWPSITWHTKEKSLPVINLVLTGEQKKHDKRQYWYTNIYQDK